jgi:hypothetical protein
MRLASRLRRSPIPIVLALTLGACTTRWPQPVPRPGQDRFLAGPVYVTRTDGTTVLLDNVTLSADSVVGREHAGTQARVAIAAGEVQKVEWRRTNPFATAVVVLLVAAGALGVSILIGLNGEKT